MAEEQPKYKLIYFNARGRAEHIRYIFAYAGIDYIDERISNDRWPELKKCKCRKSGWNNLFAHHVNLLQREPCENNYN